MRKIIVAAVLLFTAGISVVYAKSDPEVNQKVKNAFSKQFSGASYVQWENQDELAVAIFLLDGVRAAAYFDQEGELHATIRTLFYDQLPLAVMSAIGNKYKEATVMNIAEISNTNGTHYRILVEAGTKKHRLEVDASGNVLHVSNLK